MSRAGTNASAAAEPGRSHLDPDSGLFVLLIAGLMTVSAMSTDINLPAVPVIADSYGVPVAQAQLTVTSFFIGFGIGQLFVGPLSDRFGRRPVMLAGLGLYVVTTLGCALARSIDGLLLWRTVQGLVAAAGPVLARAVIRDRFEGARMARVLSLATAAFVTAPIVAPSIGAVLLETGGFRWIFGFLAAYGCALWLMGWRWLDESLREPDPAALSPARFASAWMAVLAHPRSRRYGLVSIVNFIALVVYLTNSPGVFMQHYGLDAGGFGLVFALVAIASAAGSLTNARLVRRIALERLVLLAPAVGATACGIAALAALAGMAPLWLLVGLLALAFFCFSTVMSNATALAMQPHGSIVGAASSVLGVLQTVIPALIASLVATWLGSSAVVTAAVMGAAFLMAFLLARHSPPASQRADVRGRLSRFWYSPP